MQADEIRIGDKIWLNQGDCPSAEVLEINATRTKVKVHIRGWMGRHWYPIAKFERLHPMTNKEVQS